MYRKAVYGTLSQYCTPFCDYHKVVLGCQVPLRILQSQKACTLLLKLCQQPITSSINELKLIRQLAKYETPAV